MDESKHPTFLKLVNLVRFTKYGLFIGALLIALPLTAYRPVPLHRLFGNMFHDLYGWHIFFLTVAMCGAAWSLLFTQGLIIQGLPIRYRIEHLGDPVQEERVGGLIHHNVRGLLTVPVTRGQVLLVALFSVFGVVVINQFAGSGLWLSLTMTLLGVVTSLLVVIVPVALVRLVFPDYTPLQFLKDTHRAWFWAVVEGLGRVPGLRWLRDAARWCVKKARSSFEWVSAHLWMEYLLQDKYLPNHFLAFLATLTLAGILIGVGFVFPPGDPNEAPPAFYLYVLLMLLIWVFSYLDFHLSRRHLSPLLIVLAAVLLGDWIHGRDHYFEVVELEAARPAVGALAPDGENLVVVASTGGGITAAGWTTWALKELIAARPDLRRELGLVSAVSGGSVGTAFFVDGLAQCDWKTEPAASELDPSDAQCLEAIYQRSVAPSLGAIAFGFAYPDFWRLFTAGILPWDDVDRGTYLEDSWRRIAAGTLGQGVNGEPLTEETGRRTVTSYSSLVEAGQVPAFILSTTAMESGRRVMITPVVFESPCLYGPEADAGTYPGGTEGARHGKERGCTLYEYLDAPAPIDIDLWTAARLSATFPWVCPASRAKLELGCNRSMHHMVDGGYYDNYGVASALDWLEPVLRADLKRPRLKRIAFVELRASATGRPALDEPRPGSWAALIGPLVGLLETSEASALERNRIATTRFLSKWAELAQGHRDKEAEGLDIQRFVFETSDTKDLPLSWKLSVEQKRDIEAEWAEPPVQKKLEAFLGFLDGHE